MALVGLIFGYMWLAAYLAILLIFVLKVVGVATTDSKVAP